MPTRPNLINKKYKQFLEVLKLSLIRVKTKKLVNKTIEIFKHIKTYP